METTYYDPLIGAGIVDLLRPETKVVFLESPVLSLTSDSDVWIKRVTGNNREFEETNGGNLEWQGLTIGKASQLVENHPI